MTEPMTDPAKVIRDALDSLMGCHRDPGPGAFCDCGADQRAAEAALETLLAHAAEVQEAYENLQRLLAAAALAQPGNELEIPDAVLQAIGRDVELVHRYDPWVKATRVGAKAKR